MTATAAPRRAARTTRTTRAISPTRYGLILGSLGILLVAMSLAAIAIGAVAVPLDRVVAIIGHNVIERPAAVTWLPVEEQIVWDFRVPRVLLASAVGAGLALVGAVLQALVRNPLADPYLLGVSSGASLGAVVVLVLGSAAVGGASLSVAAFAGSLGALVIVYLLAQHRGRMSTSRLILAGVAMAYLFQAVYSFIIQKPQVGRQPRQFCSGSWAACRGPAGPPSACRSPPSRWARPW